MRRFTIILALLAVAAVSPPAALGKANGTDRPSSGKSSSTTTVDLATGTGSVRRERSALAHRQLHVHERHHVVHAHRTGHVQPHAHGSRGGGQRRRDLHDRHRDGDLTPTGSETTLVSTIIGGTGRFADASGTLTSKITSVTVSVVGTTVTNQDTEIHEGRISY